MVEDIKYNFKAQPGPAAKNVNLGHMAANPTHGLVNLARCCTKLATEERCRKHGYEQPRLLGPVLQQKETGVPEEKLKNAW